MGNWPREHDHSVWAKATPSHQQLCIKSNIGARREPPWHYLNIPPNGLAYSVGLFRFVCLFPFVPWGDATQYPTTLTPRGDTPLHRPTPSLTHFPPWKKACKHSRRCCFYFVVPPKQKQTAKTATYPNMVARTFKWGVVCTPTPLPSQVHTCVHASSYTSTHAHIIQTCNA